MFRQTLIVHDQVKLDYTLRPEAAMHLRIASRAKPTAADADITIVASAGVSRRRRADAHDTGIR